MTIERETMRKAARENALAVMEAKDQLTRLREDRGMTQSDIVELTGLSLSRIQDFESFAVSSDDDMSVARVYSIAVGAYLRINVEPIA